MEVSSIIRAQLSPSETNKLVNLLRKCEPGNLPREVFEAMARVAVYPALELVVLRKIGETLEVLLLRRPKDDLTWPNMLHTPGTVLRPTDRCIEDAFERLANTELPGVSISEPQFSGVHLNILSRGAGLGIEYWATVQGDFRVGESYDVKKLPSDFIPEQKSLLQRAISAFEVVR